MFRKLSFTNSQEKREEYRNNPIYRIVYTPLWRQRGDDLSPVEVWMEGNNLAASLKDYEKNDCRIRVQEAFEDLCDRYSCFVNNDKEEIKRCFAQAEHSAMMVSLVAFLLLANVYPEAKGHPHLKTCQAITDVISNISGYKQLYEEARKEEDEREEHGEFIDVADFIEEIATQEEPLMPAQIEFACKRLEEFINENRFCNISTMVDNERMISRINDANNHCFDSQLESLRAMIDNVRENLSGSSQDSRINEQIDEMLARAIENCQKYFWGNSAYAVVFCIYRDVLNMKPNMSAFENKVEALPYKKTRDFKCSKGTIANAFSDNPIYKENVDKWDNYNPLPRIVKLRDELRKELKL